MLCNAVPDGRWSTSKLIESGKDSVRFSLSTTSFDWLCACFVLIPSHPDPLSQSLHPPQLLPFIFLLKIIPPNTLYLHSYLSSAFVFIWNFSFIDTLRISFMLLFDFLVCTMITLWLMHDVKSIPSFLPSFLPSFIHSFIPVLFSTLPSSWPLPPSSLTDDVLFQTLYYPLLP